MAINGSSSYTTPACGALVRSLSASDVGTEIAACLWSASLPLERNIQRSMQITLTLTKYPSLSTCHFNSYLASIVESVATLDVIPFAMMSSPHVRTIFTTAAVVGFTSLPSRKSGDGMIHLLFYLRLFETIWDYTETICSLILVPALWAYLRLREHPLSHTQCPSCLLSEAPSHTFLPLPNCE